MGLGKTAQLIASLLADPLPAPTLVVAPVTLLGNWRRELERFAPNLVVGLHHGPQRPRTAATLRRQVQDLGPGGVLLTSYGVLSRDAAALAQLSWGRLVFDEAQQLKNPYTAMSRAAATLQGERRVALTGTPVENRLLELWALLQLLNPGLLGSLAQFRPHSLRTGEDLSPCLRFIAPPQHGVTVRVPADLQTRLALHHCTSLRPSHRLQFRRQQSGKLRDLEHFQNLVHHRF
jgi:hypothetical protein